MFHSQVFPLSNKNGKETNIWMRPYSVFLRSMRWFETDVSGIPIGLIFMGQDVQDILIFEDGTDRYSRNVAFKPRNAVE